MASAEYWIKRQERNLIAAEKLELVYEKNLLSLYRTSTNEIQKEINNVFSKYMIDGKLEYSSLQNKLTISEMNTFRNSLKIKLNYAQNNSFDPSYINSLKRRINGSYRVSRLQAMQDNINFEIEKLKTKEYVNATKLLQDSYKDSYYKSTFDVFKRAKAGTSFTMLNKKAIESALKTKWAGDNYSGRIWKNKQQLVFTLEQEIPRNIIMGEGPDKLAKVISDKMGVDYRKAKRLARTELNYIYNQGTKESYKATGVTKRYRFIATLDERTSDICSSLDNMEFDVKEAEVGVNYPPMHPHCRSTTISIFDDVKYEERAAKGEDGYYKVPANMTYDQWYNKYVK